MDNLLTVRHEWFRSSSQKPTIPWHDKKYPVKFLMSRINKNLKKKKTEAEEF